MTSINTTSLQQFSSLFNTSSSSIISDEYKKNLYLAKIAREDKRISTQNHIESVVETTQEGQNISHFSDEVTLSQSTKYSTPKPSATTSNLKTNTSENNQVHDNTLHQLKVRKNDLQQKLNRLTQKGSNQIPLSHHEESRGKVHDAEESATSPTNVLPTEESPLAHVLKRQIDTIEQELDKNSTTSAIGESFNSTNGLNVSQLRQKKTRLEQQLRSMENKTPGSRSMVPDINHTTIGGILEKQEDSPHQNHMEALRIKQEIKNLENEINAMERKKITYKTQAALNEKGNVSSEPSTENHLIDIEV